jgi:formylglycine-generating enzyme required for sulfatase activity
MSLQVFLCHAHQDKEAVRQLYQQLKAEGFSPWLDEEDLIPGLHWQQEIYKAVRKAHVVLVCLSRSAVKQAGFVHTEIGFALDIARKQPPGTIFIIPVRLEPLDADDIPEDLSVLHWVSMFEERGYNQLLRALHHRSRQCNLEPVKARETVVPPEVRTRCNPLFPVTIPEWRDELEHRSTVFGAPAGYWCYVRSGHYLVGGWDQGDAVETIALPGFWVAQYPITVQQYRQFMQAGGYANQDYWTPNGWQWKEAYNNGKGRTRPYHWEHERFNHHDNQPVVTVTWYEAAAFAAWLHAQLADTLPDGYAIRLPTEAEWEAAAAYDAAGKRRTYPWGEEEPDASRADFGKDWSRGQPAPVGEHPAGAAACGAQNLAGSVWEATTSSYKAYPAGSGAVVEDLAKGSRDVPWRGGAWGNGRTHVRCAARYGYHLVDDYNLNFGGRVVVSPCVRTDVLLSES